MAEVSERRESTRVPMQFLIASSEGVWRKISGDLGLNGVRIDQITPFDFRPITGLKLQLAEEIQPRQVTIKIKRYFITDKGLHAAALFEDLDFNAEMAIARAIDNYSP